MNMVYVKSRLNGIRICGTFSINVAYLSRVAFQAIMEAIQRAKAENPNAIIKEVVITRTDEESAA